MNSNPRFSYNRLSSEAARIRYDAIDQQFGEPGGTRLYTTDNLGLPVDPDSAQGMKDHFRVKKSLAESSMPVSHLNGLQFMHVLPAAMPSGIHGLYVPRTKTMALDGSLNARTRAERAQGAHTVIHELGHHVDTMTNGTPGRRGRGGAEAVAENYADRYTPGVPVTHAGVTVEYRPTSTYDTHVPNPDSTAFNSRQDPTGQQNRAVYIQQRRQGLMPWE